MGTHLNIIVAGPFKLVAKNLIEVARAPWINIIVNYCCTRVLLYTEMLQKTETEETILFFVTFLSLVAFQLGGGGPPRPPLATPMGGVLKDVLSLEDVLEDTFSSP